MPNPNPARLDNFCDTCEADPCMCDIGESCFECGGEGYVVADCFEDTCCCANPEEEHGLIVCPNCRGEG